MKNAMVWLKRTIKQRRQYLSPWIPEIQDQLDLNNETRRLSLYRVGDRHPSADKMEIKACFAPRTLQEAGM